MKSGFTIVQLITTLVIISICAGFALPRMGGSLDGIAVRGAAADVAGAFAVARYTALSRSMYVAVRIDSVRRAVLVTSGSDTLLLRRVGDAHGVALRSNRDSMAYDPVGHGYGAANQSIVISRGSAVDTVVISRVGRVMYRG